MCGSRIYKNETNNCSYIFSYITEYMCGSRIHKNETNNCSFLFIRTMNTSRFYGTRFRGQIVPGPSHEESSRDSSTDGDSSFSEISSPSSGTDTEDAVNDTANDEPTDEAAASDHMEDSSDSWLDVSASQRQYPFTGKEELVIKPTPTGPENAVTPYDVFRLFVTDELIDLIVTETNRFAEQCIQATHVTRRSRLTMWTPTNADEMRKFLGLLIVMGLVRKPRMELYWSKKSMYDYPFVYQNMTRDRFFLLLKHMHFNDNTFLERSNRLYKIEPVVKMLNENFQATYSPGPSLVVDESLIPFRGRLAFRQYIPGKSHKYGVKLYKLCSPDGYTWNLQIYCGNIEREANFNHSESVVLQLCRPMLVQGATVFADNFYSSVPLAEKLLEEKTYYCGTLRQNRKFVPKSVLHAKLKKGETVCKQNASGVKASNWKDKRNVLTLSTIPEHTGELIATGKKSRSGNDILKPGSVLDYNKAKKGVDVSDQMSAYSTPLRRSTKWYRKIAIELLAGTSVVNAWAIFNKYCCAKPISIIEFRENIASILVTGKPVEAVKSGKRASNIDGKRAQHTLVEGSKGSNRKRCRECYSMLATNEGSNVARAKCRRVNTFCNDCEGKPYLCVNCFSVTHSN